MADLGFKFLKFMGLMIKVWFVFIKYTKQNTRHNI